MRTFLKTGKQTLLITGCLLAYLTTLVTGIFTLPANNAGADSAQPAWVTDGFSKIVSGSYSSCGFTTTNQVWCWGADIMNFATQTPNIAPYRIDNIGVFAGKTITDLSMTFDHACAIASGKAYCWGSNNHGQLGNASLVDSSLPVAVDTSGVLAGKTITEVQAGNQMSCAMASGKAYCWGSNTIGLLGIDNQYQDEKTPVAVDTSGVLAGKVVTDIEAPQGGGSTCAIASGKAYCWGINLYLTLGSNVSTMVQGYSGSTTPIAVDDSGVLAGKTITQMGASYQNVCVVADGNGYCWGKNSHGQFGNNTTTDSATPVSVDTSGLLAGTTMTQIEPSGNTTCAIADAKAYCWGLDTDGREGNPSGSDDITPIAVDDSGVLLYQTVTQISGNNYAGCALASNTAYCWGSNQFGNLGNYTIGQTGGSPSPVAVIDDPPTIHSAVQTVSCNGSSKTVTVQGWNIASDTTITIDGVSVMPTSISYVYQDEPLESVTFTVPGSLTPHTADITMTNTDGKSLTQVGGLTYGYLQATTTTVTPYRISLNATSVTVTGTNFYAATTVTLNGVAIPVTAYTDTTLTLAVPSTDTEGVFDFTISNPGVFDAFAIFERFNPLAITSISPSTVPTGTQSKTITVYGSGLGVNTTMTYNGITLTALYEGYAPGLSRAIFSIPASLTVQSYDVTFANTAESEQVTIPHGLQFVQPVITGIDYTTNSNLTIMNVRGIGLSDGTDGSGLSQSLLSLNGTALPFCTTPTYSSQVLLSYQIDPTLFSDAAPCYVYLVDTGPNAPFGLTDTLYTVELPGNFDRDQTVTVQTNNTSAFTYTPGTIVTHYITGVPTGFTAEDDTNQDLSSVGTTSSTIDVSLRDTSGLPLATIPVDMTASRDWSGVSGGTSQSEHKSFAHGLTIAPGSLSGTFTLYVPKGDADNSVVICPGASSLTAVSASCPNARTYSASTAGVSIVHTQGFTYWAVSGLTGTGGVSLFIPSTGTTTASNSLLNTGINLAIVAILSITIIGLAVVTSVWHHNFWVFSRSYRRR